MLNAVHHLKQLLLKRSHIKSLVLVKYLKIRARVPPVIYSAPRPCLLIFILPFSKMLLFLKSQLITIMSMPMIWVGAKIISYFQVCTFCKLFSSPKSTIDKKQFIRNAPISNAIYQKQCFLSHRCLHSFAISDQALD